nr:reverse transcriptase domain-containing protein [Tanacetum cinerariifolium]
MRKESLATWDGGNITWGGRLGVLSTVPVCVCAHERLGRSKQPFILEESLVDTIADQRTMAELLRALTEDQFFGLEKDNPYYHIRWGSPLVAKKEPSRFIHTWEDLVSKFINEFFSSSRTTNLCNEILNFQQRFDESFHEAWDRYKDLLRACPRHDFTEFHQLDTFYNALNPANQDSLNAAGGNLLERRTQDVLTIIENKSKCLATGGNTFPELRDNIQGYVSAAAVNYNQGNSVYHPLEQSYQAPTQQYQNVPLNELEKVKRINEANMKAMQTQINMVKNELRNEMKNSIQASLSNQTNEIKNMVASLFQMNNASTSGSGSLPSITVANPKGELKAITTRSGLVIDGSTVPTPPLFINPEEDERVDETLTDPNLAEYTIKLHINITLADALLLMLKYQKMLKALLSNKEKLQELANTPLNENCLAVIIKKLPEKLGDPEEFLISCGFSKLKCKALADLGASINLMPLSVWKKFGLPELISTRMTLELANQAICTPAGIARDVFVSVGKFTFPADFVIVDYDSDPRVPIILGRPFLRTARALIDVHGEEMILRDGDERLTLNMRHDTSSYSNQPQKESINLINVFNNLKGGNVLPKKLLDLDSTKDLHPPLHVNSLSCSTTYFSSPYPLLEELADRLTLITFPLKYDDDLQFDIESDLKEIELLLHKDIDSSLKDSIDQRNLDNFVDSVSEMFTDEHALDYSSPSKSDEYDDVFLEIKSNAKNVYDDPFDSKGEKIKEVDALPSTNNEDKIFNPGILSQEKPFEIITRVVQDKKLALSNAFSILEDFDPPFYEPFFFKEVPRSKILRPFSSENEEKVFKPGIYTSEKVHYSIIPELSHQDYKVFKINQVFKSPMKIFLFSCGKATHILAIPCVHFYPLDQFKYGGISILENLKTNTEGFCLSSLHFLSFIRES